MNADAKTQFIMEDGGPVSMRVIVDSDAGKVYVTTGDPGYDAAVEKLPFVTVYDTTAHLTEAPMNMIFGGTCQTPILVADGPLERAAIPPEHYMFAHVTITKGDTQFIYYDVPVFEKPVTPEPGALPQTTIGDITSHPFQILVQGQSIFLLKQNGLQAGDTIHITASVYGVN